MKTLVDFDGIRNNAVVNSYGATECPGISNNGIVAESIELRLEDVPDPKGEGGGYLSTDEPYPRGQIVVRSKQHMTEGYWNMPEETRKSFKDGWFYTGDIGELRTDADGTKHLTILTRAKAVCELYIDGRSVWVSPSKVEGAMRDLPELAQVMAVGDRQYEGMFMVVVLEPGFAAAYCKERGIDDVALLASDARLRQRLLNAMRRVGEERGLEEYEVPVGLVMETKAWTEADGLVTHTGKIKRAKLHQKYTTQVSVWGCGGVLIPLLIVFSCLCVCASWASS